MFHDGKIAKPVPGRYQIKPTGLLSTNLSARPYVCAGLIHFSVSGGAKLWNLASNLEASVLDNPGAVWKGKEFFSGRMIEQS
jgi:hypothetical protein